MSAVPLAEDAPWSGPDPGFSVIGARPVRHAAAPMLELELEVSEPSGRQVYMMALRINVMIEPARRAYDERAHRELVELFGPPERWSVTTRPLVWAQPDVLVPAFTGTNTVTVPIACGYDLEIAATRYLDALSDGFAPLALHFNGTIYYRGEDGGLQMVLVPWTKSIDFRLPAAVWRETIAEHYPDSAWLGLRRETLEALREARRRRGARTLDETLTALLESSAS